MNALAIVAISISVGTWLKTWPPSAALIAFMIFAAGERIAEAIERRES